MKLFLLISMMDNSGKNKLVARAGDCIQLNISEELSRKYTMVTLKADVDASTPFAKSSGVSGTVRKYGQWKKAD